MASSVSKSMYVFGLQTSSPVSTIFHSHVFERLGLPWAVSFIESGDLQDLRNAVRSPSFGGAAITLPYKTAVMPLMDRLTDEAKVMYSFNTVFVQQDDDKRVVTGTNTGWNDLALAVTGPSNRLGHSDKGRGAVVFGDGVLRRAADFALATGLRVDRIYLVQADENTHHTLAQSFSDAGLGV